MWDCEAEYACDNDDGYSGDFVEGCVECWGDFGGCWGVDLGQSEGAVLEGLGEGGGEVGGAYESIIA